MMARLRVASPVVRTSVEIAYLPDGFRRSNVDNPVACDPQLSLTREGDCFLAVVDPFDLSDSGCRNHIHVGESLVYLMPGERVPLILAYRRSMMEFASRSVDYSLRAGNTVWILGGDGYAGSYECALPEYGKAISATVLGAIPGAASGTALNLKDFALPETAFPAEPDPPVVAVVGSRMDCGKSTAIRSLATSLRAAGHCVAAGKVTGFGCRYETTGLQADISLDFTDFGLPSTCGKNGDRVIRVAQRILEDLRRSDPDVVILEFGGGLIDFYRVGETLAALRHEIDLTIFVAFDLYGVDGGIARLRALGAAPQLVTGPVANTPVGIALIESRHGLPAETNRDGMPKLLEMATALLRAKREERNRTGPALS